MIKKFAKTTWRLWMDVPGKPPLWKCAMVAYLIASAPKQSQMGSISIDELLESAEEEDKTYA